MIGRRAPERLQRVARALLAELGRMGRSEPTFHVAFPPALLVAALLFARSPYTNFIFDEQEALLANPYVNGDTLRFTEVFTRDFWGLPPERSIGSYRPLPNVVWRLVWKAHPKLQHPWVHHALNVLLHAANAALLASTARRMGLERASAWLSGAVFLTAAVLTEAVAGVVGLADVLGGLGVLLALRALCLPLAMVPLGVFGGLTVGLFSKESTVAALPLVALAAMMVTPHASSARLRRLYRGLVATIGALGSLVLYTEVRRALFSSHSPGATAPALPPEAGALGRALEVFFAWFSQPKLPADPINNPLVEASFVERVSLGLEIYARGLSQVIFPWTLSGDYSYAVHPLPERLIGPWSVLGGLLMVGPIVLGLVLWAVARGSEARRAHLGIVALVCVWVPVAYFPHSNIPVVLPTVRAERFWYLPLIGGAMGLGLWLRAIAAEGFGRHARAGLWVVAAFLGFQAIRARVHALNYSSDLRFWAATARAAPRSAKAHLNHGVMLGARGRLPERLEASRRALELAPHWPMAHVYHADTLCRLHRPDEAWPHYAKGFSLAPNDRNLIALGVQCLWDEKAIKGRRTELLELADQHSGSWVSYLIRDILKNGKRHGGVDPKHRPRGYDEGPRKR
jgi:hypothetical protein